MKKRNILLTLMLLVTASAFAVDEVEIDGLWYAIDLKDEVKVIQSKGSQYSGDIVIDENIWYGNNRYTVTEIDKNAFNNCTGLTSVWIANSVKSIGYRAFYGCSSLKSVTIPNSLTNIGGYAFCRCRCLTSVTIPNSLPYIGDGMFEECSGLTSITIPNSVISIGYGAFAGCSSLTSVTIPNSVSFISSWAFQLCSSLTSINIPNSVTSIYDYTFESCSSLTSIIIPSSVTYIGSYAFANCNSLISMTIPNSVTSIGYNAFRSCSDLTTITIGNGVKTIYEKAFSYCPKLTDVYCYAEILPSMKDRDDIYYGWTDAFEGSSIEYATLHVPTVSINAYKSQAPWSDFGTIVGIEDTLPDPPDSKQCATPTIAYDKGEITFSCETEGVKFVGDVKVSDTRSFEGGSIKLMPIYEISVYSTKDGYDNSDVAKAMILWREGRPQFMGFSSIIVDEMSIADVNGDGQVGIGDIVAITNIMAGKSE